MSFQAVRRIVLERPLADGRAEVALELACGCALVRRLDERRLVTTVEGARLAVGKYPCPVGHPVARGEGPAGVTR